MQKTPRQQAVEIAEQAYEALLASRRGETHPRLINYMERSISERLQRAQAHTLRRKLSNRSAKLLNLPPAVSRLARSMKRSTMAPAGLAGVTND